MNGALKKSSTSILLFLGLLGLYPTFAQRANEAEVPVRLTSQEWGLTRHQEIKSLTKAMAPVFVESLAPDHGRKDAIILFTYADENIKRSPAYKSTLRGEQELRSLSSKNVRIAFAHEGWKNTYPLTHTHNVDFRGHEADVWFLYWSLPREVQLELQEKGEELEYRFIVDGIWTADPMNPRQKTKLNGSVISLLSLEEAPHVPVISPEILHETAASKSKAWYTAATSRDMERLALTSRNKTRTVVLRYISEPGRELYVQGTFNHFDPYMNRLVEKEPWAGNPDLWVYETELRLLPGQYFYTYYIDGQTGLDPLNKEVGTGPEGTLYSVFSVH